MMRKKIRISTIEDTRRFVEICSHYEDEINVYSGRYIIDGKSIMGILSLNLLEPVEVEILSNNEISLNSFAKLMKQFEVAED